MTVTQGFPCLGLDWIHDYLSSTHTHTHFQTYSLEICISNCCVSSFCLHGLSEGCECVYALV